tara:strand:- start:3826 stop:4779 length:954 start_codon:yes stop_codon:yes gene_type:complete
MNKIMKIAYVMDPPGAIKPYKDSSIALMQAASAKGHENFYLMQDGLYIKNNMAGGLCAPVHKADQTAFEYGEWQDRALGDFDVIFMRKDPPVDKAFIQTTYILDQAIRDGADIINSPAALRHYNEKIYATLFPDLIPQTLISANADQIYTFIQSLERAVLKPVDMMGGYGVFVTDKQDHNLDVIIEMLTGGGRTHIIVQNFLPEIQNGDRRLIMINGAIADHALVRYPKDGSLRGNMAAGGTYKVEPVNDRDRHIAGIVGPRLVQDGIILAGLDVIGGHLIEINHTSPTGLREIHNLAGEDVSGKIIESAALYAARK